MLLKDNFPRAVQNKKALCHFEQGVLGKSRLFNGFGIRKAMC